LKERRAEIVVSKNSGGAATYGKIEAARLLRLPVVMIERPHKAARHTVNGTAQAMRWLEARLHQASSERGV
jgi:precorrin-6A/cobalt-precorrin-6A reductase